MKPVMVIDLNLCTGCGACTAACLAENSYKGEKGERPNVIYSLISKYLPIKLYKGRPLKEILKEAKGNPEILNLFEPRTKIVRVEEGEYPNVNVLLWHKMCVHCDDAPCVSVCPTAATYQTKEGIVLVNKEKCILCGACIVACPYGARSVDPSSYTVDKCTFCYHRITKGQKPACVETCPTGARMFGDLDDPNDPIREKVREGVLGTPKGPKEESGKLYFILPSRKV
ncbi:4Fe-4S ferredoxin [Ignicoccus islandicus DSM 13165]|uniref:4Fe-4S ferredoxin n=1 Tax=Ignicoccus islandicus DSM 13165 TaxID=940295 RepID=A0A0U2M917_9CREN|nr:4Fe-4S dicluster domain-containing protein [Ignicoccus islandicus]ALU11421.1 4Fe-4S ferredoxin [Ignicoccus islandicus DSM 13165]